MVKLETESRPGWMTDELLISCIKKSQNLPSHSVLTLEDITISYVVPKGENYMSIMYRAGIRYKNQGEIMEESLVLKTSHEGELLDFLTTLAFEREADMYDSIMPALENILEGSNVYEKLVCRCLHSDMKSQPRLLVLEDLKPRGFGVEERRKGLDLKTCKIVYGKLAKFHAASMHFLQNQNQEFKQKYKTMTFNFDESEEMHEMLKSSVVKKSSDIIKDLLTFGGKYDLAIEFYKIYKSMTNQVKTYQYMSQFRADNKFNAIIHADCWVNNLMFKYADDTKLEDVLFIDLQRSYYNSVAYDFVHFFFSSTDLETRSGSWKELKHFYFESLVANLTAIGYQGVVPTLKEFDRELKRYVLVGCFLMTIMLPLMLKEFDSQSQSREESKVFSMSDIANFLNNHPHDPTYRSFLLASTDVMLKEGFFDHFPV